MILGRNLDEGKGALLDVGKMGFRSLVHNNCSLGGLVGVCVAVHHNGKSAVVSLRHLISRTVGKVLDGDALTVFERKCRRAAVQRQSSACRNKSLSEHFRFYPSG